MPILYKVITAVLSLTGCASLFITGEMNPLMSVSGLAILPGYYSFLKGRQHAPKWAVSTLSGLTLLVFFVDSAVITGDVFIAVAHLTITFQAIKSFDLKEPWDHLQVYFMSLLQLIIASELTRSLTFGVIFVLFMILLVTAMVLSHFLKEGSLVNVNIKRPVFFILLLTILTTVGFFVVLPRPAYKLVGKSNVRGIKTAGFSEQVDFGTFGDIKLDPTVVMRIKMDRDISMPYYWRGLTLDYFDGLSWKSTKHKKYRIEKYEDEFVLFSYDRRAAVEQKIYLEPIDSDIIFGLSDVAGVKVDTFSLLFDDEKSVYMRTKYSRRVKYTVYSVVTDSFAGMTGDKYLQMPEGMERIKGLSKKLTSTIRKDDQKAAFIEQYLKKNYKYSLSASPPPAGTNPIEDFLFNTKSGYCEHYATSMVIMLRSIGISARIVNGFYGGEKNIYGDYVIVRQSDAHSWVEAFVDEKWKRFDPTPYVPQKHPSVYALFLDSVKLSWSRYVVGFSSDDQKDIIKGVYLSFKMLRLPHIGLRDIRSLMYFVPVSAILFCLLYYLFRKTRHVKYGFVTEKYLLFRKLMKKKGIKIGPSVTAGNLRNEAFKRGFGKDVEEFIALYEENRFGQKEMTREEKKRYAGILKQIRRSPD